MILNPKATFNPYELSSKVVIPQKRKEKKRKNPKASKELHGNSAGKATVILLKSRGVLDISQQPLHFPL